MTFQSEPTKGLFEQQATTPNLFLVGPGRTGTTSLFRHLAAHPDICGGRRKEIGGFMPLIFGESSPDLAIYRAEFDRCLNERWRLDATPGYFFGGRAMAEALDDNCGGAHVVITLRDPSARMFSLYRHVNNKVLFGAFKTFGDYVAACAERSPGQAYCPQTIHLSALDEGRYDLLYEGWRAVFGPKRLRVLFYEDLERRPERLLYEMERWLGLAEGTVSDQTPLHDNRAVEYRVEALQRLASAVNDRFEPILNRHPRLRHRLRNAYYAINGRSRGERPDRETWIHLERIYAPHMRRLAALLRDDGYRDLPGWLSRGSL